LFKNRLNLKLYGYKKLILHFARKFERKFEIFFLQEPKESFEKKSCKKILKKNS